MNRVLFCLSICLSALLTEVAAQQNEKTTLSVNEQTTLLLLKMDSIHKADSLKKLELVSEMEKLRASDNRNKSQLLSKLHELEEKDSLEKVKQHEQLSKLKASAIGYPVTPFGDTLFFIYTRIAAYSAEERAQAVSNKIVTLSKSFQYSLDSIKVTKAETTVDIVVGDLILMSVNDLEALWFDKSQETLAHEYLDIIQKSVEEEIDRNSIRTLIIRVVEVILIVAGIYFLIVMINRLFKRLVRKLISLKDLVLKGVRIKGYQLLDSHRELQVFLFLINILRMILISIALYITLPLLFSVFPWTRGIAEMLLRWFTTPLSKFYHAIVKYLPNLITIIVILVVIHYTIKLFRYIANEIHRGALSIPGFYADWAFPTFNIVKVLLYAFMFVTIYPYLPGSGSAVFQGVSVFLGLLVSFGSSSAISNAVAGLVITYMRPFKIGDRIKIGEVTGDVIEKSALVTRVRTIKNEIITIPNSAVLSGHTINYTSSAKESGLILHVTITIGYDVPWRQVHELLVSAALSTRDILKEGRVPFVLQTSLDDFYVSYQINAYTEESHSLTRIYSELYQNIQDKFNEAGVEIMSPHYKALRDGNTIAIPGNYVSKDYTPPAFKVNTDKPERNTLE